jgi:hypothetical protein
VYIVIKLRYRRAIYTPPEQPKRFAVGCFNNGNVAIVYRNKLQDELPGAPEPKSLSMDDKWKGIEKTVRKVATTTPKTLVV